MAAMSVCGAIAAACAAAAPAATATPPAAAAANWDGAQQRQVVAAGLMDEGSGSFDGADRLSAAQANTAMTALASRLQRAANRRVAPSKKSAPGEAGGPGEGGGPGESNEPGEPSGSDESSGSEEPGGSAEQATTAEATLTGEPASSGEQAATAEPNGTALAAVPAAHTAQSPVTVVTFDGMLARAMTLSAGDISGARKALTAFALPQPSAAQRQALRIAVSRIGYPYVWGGTTDNTADGLEHGGFDCSGFAWRVYKVSGLPWGKAIRGRTAAEQAGEIPRSQRLQASQLEPGDLLFFGSAHLDSRATEKNVIHEGIYLGDNWVIHSSGQGVYVLPLSGSWLGSSFAWGRRVIR
jgi:cell wall-associated NlpC family hydrolase